MGKPGSSNIFCDIIEKKQEGLKLYELDDEMFDIQFNSGTCSNKQEYQAIELVKKHREGIAVFEYEPERSYNRGDGIDVERYSGDNNSNSAKSNLSISTSLNSLVKGNVFADVRAKLKSLYKSMNKNNDSNKDPTWKVNLIQKRKEKLKKQGNVINGCDMSESSKSINCFRKCKSSILNIKECSKSKNSDLQKDKTNSYIGSSKVDNLSEIGIDDSEFEKFSSNNNMEQDLYNTFDSHYKIKDVIERQQNVSSEKSNEIEILKDLDKSSHHFVIDYTKANDHDDGCSVHSDKNDDDYDNSTNTLVKLLKTSSSEDVGTYIYNDILEGMNITRTSLRDSVLDVGFIYYDDNNNENNDSVDYINSSISSSDENSINNSILIHNYKRDIGFSVESELKSYNNKLDLPSNCSRTNINCSVSDIKKKFENNEKIINISQSNGISTLGFYSKLNKIKFDAIQNTLLTDDESQCEHEFVSFVSKNQDNNSTELNNNNSYNNNSPDTSSSEIYYSFSADDSKQNVSSILKIDSDNVVNNSISKKYIEDGVQIFENEDIISIVDYEHDSSVINTSKTVINSKTLKEEEIYETDDIHSTNSIAGSPNNSISLSSHETFETTLSVISDKSNNEVCLDNLSTGKGDCFRKTSEVFLTSSNSSASFTSATNKHPQLLSKKATDNTNKSDDSPQEKRYKWAYAELISSDDDSSDVSVVEEYLYTDEDDGIELIEERHLPINKIEKASVNKILKETSSNGQGKEICLQGIKKQADSESELSDPVSSVDMEYETDELRKDLKKLGLSAGPITGNTKRVYLRHLKRTKRKPHRTLSTSNTKSDYSPELERFLNIDNKDVFVNWSPLEIEMSKPFQCPDPKKRWREGLAKTSFTYLLLDPRITQDLPFRVEKLNFKEQLSCFLKGIFYVGRGKRTRPYAHLSEAVSVWNQWKNVSSKKINKILDIWKSGQGVVCLHVFQNVMPAEAMTREAAMIDAIGLCNLTNERIGDYYGIAASWNLRQRQQVGTILLVRALCVLIGEGERQLRPLDIS